MSARALARADHKERVGGTMRRFRSGIAVALVAMLVLASCSDDKKTTSTGSNASSSSSNANEPLTASFRGITATEIKIGVAAVDFKCIADFVDFNQGDAEKIITALVADLNKKGGIGGRQLKIVFKSLCPLQPQDTQAACTAFTDDEQVFAVIGVYDTPPSDGSNQLCLTKDKETILIDELTTQKTMDGATDGLLLSPHINPERRLTALLSLIKQEKQLDGKKVALLADQNNQEAAQKAVTDFASAAGLETGDTAVLTITNDDTTAAQQQLDSFIEKWKEQKVTALVMAGLLVSAKQFVEKIRAALPDITLVADDSGVGEQASDEVKAGKTPNPYEGLLTLNGLNDDETFALQPVQDCVKAYETESGDKVIAPKDLKPGADGKTAKVFEGLEDRCNELAILKQLFEKAGPNPTNDSWIAAVNSFGTLKLPTSPIASFDDGKYDADDGFRLATWDSTISTSGDFKPLGEIADVTK
jgi:ABC-type branched-subunit amino acid transport system substrate-binding protein